MAVLGLRFCARASSSCGKWGPLFIAVRGASHYRGLSRCGAQAPDAQAQQLWLRGLVAPRHVGSSQTRARTRVPCIGRQILNHCATREAQGVTSWWLRWPVSPSSHVWLLFTEGDPIPYKSCTTLKYNMLSKGRGTNEEMTPSPWRLLVVPLKLALVFSTSHKIFNTLKDPEVDFPVVISNST